MNPEGQSTIYIPEELKDLKAFLEKAESDNSFTDAEFVSVSDPYERVLITREFDYDEDFGGDSTYLKVSCESYNEEKVSFKTTDIDARQSLTKVEQYITENFKDGFEKKDMEQTQVDFDEQNAPSMDESVFEDMEDDFPPFIEDEQIEEELPDIKIISDYTKELGAGFFPVNARIMNGDESGALFTRAEINEIRETNPNFGFCVGFDTTEINTERGSDKQNATQFNIKFEQLEKYLDKENCKEFNDNGEIVDKFAKDKIESITVTKQFGEGVALDVDGRTIKFAMSNLVTIDVKFKDIETSSCSTTFVADDSGKVLGRIACHENSIPLDTGIEKTRIDFLDRTDANSRICIHDIKAGKISQESVLNKVEYARVDFVKSELQKFKMDFNETKGVINAKINVLQEEKNQLGELLNKAGLVYTDKCAALFDARESVNETVEKIDKTSITATEIRGKITDLDQKQDTLIEGSSPYKDIETEKQELKVELNKLESNLIELRTEFKEKCQEFEKIKADVNLEEFKPKYETIKNAYDNTCIQLSAIEATIKESKSDYHLFNLKEDDANARIEAQPEAELKELYAFEGVRADAAGVCNAGAGAVLKEASFDDVEKYVQEKVDAYNEKHEKDTEKIYRDEVSGKHYTYYGQEIDVVNKLYEKTSDNERDNVSTYNITMDKSNPVIGVDEQGKLSIDVDGKIDWQSLRDYLDMPISNDSSETRMDVLNNVTKEFAYHGNDESKVINNESADVKVSTDNEVNAIRKVIAVCGGATIDDNEFNDKVAAEKDRLERGAPEDEVEQDTSKDSSQKVDAGETYNEKKILNTIHGGYGKVDASKEVMISDAKMVDIKREAALENNNEYDKTDNAIKEKVEAKKEELNALKDKILKHQGNMERIADVVPTRILNQHTGFQYEKLQYDKAIKAYENAGGAIGKEQFVTKGVSKLEMVCGYLDVKNTNIWTTLIFNTIARMDFPKVDITSEEKAMKVSNDSGEKGEIDKDRTAVAAAAEQPSVDIPEETKEPGVENQETPDIGSEEKAEMAIDVENQTADMQQDALETIENKVEIMLNGDGENIENIFEDALVTDGEGKEHTLTDLLGDGNVNVEDVADAILGAIASHVEAGGEFNEQTIGDLAYETAGLATSNDNFNTSDILDKFYSAIEKMGVSDENIEAVKDVVDSIISRMEGADVADINGITIEVDEGDDSATVVDGTNDLSANDLQEVAGDSVEQDDIENELHDMELVGSDVIDASEPTGDGKIEDAGTDDTVEALLKQNEENINVDQTDENQEHVTNDIPIEMQNEEPVFPTVDIDPLD